MPAPMKRTLIAPAAVAALLFAAAPAHAELFSKAYAFKPNTTPEVGTDIAEGLRLDTVEFQLGADDGSPSGLFSGPKVKISISNLGTTSAKIGLALAITDADGRLVAVASGGTKLFPLRAGRQMTYSLGLDGVNSELSKGTVFRISIEPK